LYRFSILPVDGETNREKQFLLTVDRNILGVTIMMNPILSYYYDSG